MLSWAAADAAKNNAKIKNSLFMFALLLESREIIIAGPVSNREPIWETSLDSLRNQALSLIDPF
jgi:hypothetical protein